jgi:[lysine-biosynthesis-protein LysW]--L-2-aminoadipate ligase
MPPARSPLAVTASRVRVEEKWIFSALDRRQVPWLHLDPRQLWLELDGAAPRWCGVLNREISHLRSAYVARVLEAAGLPVLNSGAVIELCGDKLLTSLALGRAGLPTPRTAVALTPQAGLDALEQIGLPAVVKPLTGSWGRLAALLRDRDAAVAVMEHREALPSPQQRIVYLQELVDKPGRDIRVLVLGEEPLAAGYRSAAEWRTNAARGGRFDPCALSGDVEKLAAAAARAVGGGVLAVDLLEGRAGELYVLEVNHTPEFQRLQSALGSRIDLADAIVSYALQALDSVDAHSAAPGAER